MFNFDKNILLENKRVRLEALSISHLDVLQPIPENHPDLLQYSLSNKLFKEGIENYIKASLAQKEDSVRYPFVIFDLENQEYAGSTSFGNISNPNRRIEIGWTWIAPKFQGTGLNLNMKYLMLEYAFEKIDFQRVEFKADARNKRSIYAMEKIGAKYEGLLRSHIIMSDGHRRDSVYYSILQNEWPEIKNEIFKDKIGL